MFLYSYVSVVWIATSHFHWNHIWRR